MDHLNKNIAINLKKIRKSKKMSLDMMAAETGLSKSMLGQIERGEANPTVATIGKIISAMRIGFNDLIRTPREESYVVKKEMLTPFKSSKGNYRKYAYFPFEESRDFEIYCIEIEENSCYSCSSHGEKTAEYLVVFSGVLNVEIDGKEHILNPGDAIRFDSDKEHIYKNNGDGLLQFFLAFTWK